jgi:arylsulfatase A-like enzyme
VSRESGFTRRDFLKTAAVAAGSMSAAGSLARRAVGKTAHRATWPGKRPNVIYILADQLRYQSLGYAGDAKARTPNIDRLASQGVSFRQCVSSMPVCAAYRASLLTGKYPSSTGMAINELRINPNQRCLGHVVTEAGYETGYIGKWHLWANEAGNHNAMKNSYIPPEMKKYRLGWDGFWAAYNFNHRYYKNFYYMDEPVKHTFEGYEPDGQTDMAVDFIRKHAGKDKPFYLTLSVGTPHDPWGPDNVSEKCLSMFKDVEFPLPRSWSDVPDPYMDRNADPKNWLAQWKPNLPAWQRVYYAMTANLDDNVGRIMNAVDAAGIGNDTIIVFTSDHGEMFGANGRVFKLTFYDPAARVPMVIRWPGSIPGGLVSDACMGTPDIMPTLLGLMGHAIPDTVEGMDLSHLARGRTGPEPEFAFMQGLGHTWQWADNFEWRAVRDKRYTYAIYRRDKSELLFDNQGDPLQMRNLARDPAHGDTLERLRKQLAEKMKSLDDTFEACTWYRDHWTDGKRNIIASAKGKF